MISACRNWLFSSLVLQTSESTDWTFICFPSTWNNTPTPRLYFLTLSYFRPDTALQHAGCRVSIGRRGIERTNPLIHSLIRSKYYDEDRQESDRVLLCSEKILCVVTVTVCSHSRLTPKYSSLMKIKDLKCIIEDKWIDFILMDVFSGSNMKSCCFFHITGNFKLKMD